MCLTHAAPLGEVAQLNASELELAKHVMCGKLRLFQARRRRQTPAVDATIFSDVNGMMIDAHLTAYERLADRRAREVAVQALEFALCEMRERAACSPTGGRRRGCGTSACWRTRRGWGGVVHGFAVCLDERYIEAVQQAADYILSDLCEADGAFKSGPEIGALADLPRVRPWEDTASR